MVEFRTIFNYNILCGHEFKIIIIIAFHIPLNVHNIQYHNKQRSCTHNCMIRSNRNKINNTYARYKI